MRQLVFSILVMTFGLGVFASGQIHEHPDDSRWMPWLGCWTPAQREVFSEERAFVRLRRVGDEGNADAAPAAEQDREEPVTALITYRRYDHGRRLVCFGAIKEGDQGDPGVEMVTFINSTPVLRETLRADGIQRATADNGCRGWRSAEWSPTGNRLVHRSTSNCEISGVWTRTGVSFLSSMGLTDIETIAGPDRIRDLFVRRYRRAPPEEARAVNTTLPYDIYELRSEKPESTTKIGFDELVDVAQKVSIEVLQTAILELGTSIGINAKTIFQLDEANVPGEVVDLLVSMAFPDQYGHTASPEVGDSLRDSQLLRTSTTGVPSLELEPHTWFPFGFADQYGPGNENYLLRPDTWSFTVRRLHQGERYLAFYRVDSSEWRGQRSLVKDNQRRGVGAHSAGTGGGGSGDGGGRGGAYANPSGYHGPP